MTPEFLVAVVGIGNILAGDDGAGIEALERLRKRLGSDPRVLFLALEGDLYEIGEHLHRAGRFIFIDALAGDPPGQIVICSQNPRALAPSFHQTDIGAVMGCLRLLRYFEPFPAWEIWGITVDPPSEVGYGLSPIIADALDTLVESLYRELRLT